MLDRFCRHCGHRLSVVDTDGQCLSCRYPVRVVRGGRGFCKCGQRVGSPNMSQCLECHSAYMRRQRVVRREREGGQRGETMRKHTA